MPTICLPAYMPLQTTAFIRKKYPFFPPNSRKTRRSSSVICRASITEFDLYDLLGIDSCSDQSQVKMAYRRLQKQCHPDIAGQTGHDMAIILNEAYSVLSDPNSRLAYDKEQAKIAELRGYTGKPLYSIWLGSENEERAVFVDELKCVGCLKCALFAEKTFAIESVYGRARVVAQWADPEHTIQAAIETCPVDCISMVEKTDLPALEFLMSKQPRGNVRVGATNAAAGRASNIFLDLKKFQNRLANAQTSKETDLQIMAAIQAIRSISNWLYWQFPKSEASTSGNLPLIALPSSQPNINKLRQAAAERKQPLHTTRPSNHDYWIPSAGALPSPINSSSSEATRNASRSKEQRNPNKKEHIMEENKNPAGWRIPIVAATIAASIVHLQVREQAIDRLNEHIGGGMALEIVNSSWLQVILAGITWYLIGTAITEVVQTFRKRL